MRRACVPVMLLAIVLLGSTARAQEEPDVTATCLAAFSDAQKNRREGKLIAARYDLITCSQATCPDEIVAKCTPWLREVKGTIPTIIPVVRDSHGHDLVNARVTVDGEQVATKLDGRPIELDPGAHVVRFEAKGHEPIALDIVVAQAEKNRMVIAKIIPPAPPPAPPPDPAVLPPPPKPPPEPEPATESSISPWAWVGFAVGGAALIAGTVTGVLALEKAAEQEELCFEKLCSEVKRGPYDEGVRLAHASTAMFVVGGVGVAFGVVALIWLGDGPDDPASAGAPALVLGPGYVGARGRF